MNWLTKKVEECDRVSPRNLIWTNCVYGLIILIAYGSLIVLGYIGVIDPSDAPTFVYITVPITLVFLMLSVLAFLMPSQMMVVLQIHTLILILPAIAFFYLGQSVIVNGIPRGERLSLNPILTAFICMYPIYLARRVFLSQKIMLIPLIRYSHIYVGVGSLIVSVMIYWRIFWRV